MEQCIPCITTKYSYKVLINEKDSLGIVTIDILQPAHHLLVEQNCIQFPKTMHPQYSWDNINIPVFDRV